MQKKLKKELIEKIEKINDVEMIIVLLTVTNKILKKEKEGE